MEHGFTILKGIDLGIQVGILLFSFLGMIFIVLKINAAKNKALHQD
jgi:hypothetical protein